MANYDFDAIVIGSGISGGWAAKELTEKGLKVLLLERGRSISPADYVGEHKPAWQFPFRQLGDRKRYERDYPVQSTCYAFGEPMSAEKATTLLTGEKPNIVRLPLKASQG